MKPLIDKTFRDIEGRMHNLHRLQKHVMSHRDDVLYGSVGIDYNTPKGHSKHADNTAMKGIKLADGCIDSKWVEAIEKTFAYFKGEPEAKIITLLYAKHHNIEEASAISGLDRGTVRRMRDIIVSRCAIQAATYGLINLDSEA